MKKGILTVFLMVLAVVAGVAIRYYMQTGSFQPKEQQVQTEQAAEPEVDSQDMQAAEPDVISEDAQATESDNDRDNDWGVFFTAKDVTPEGMTLVCTQSGGAPTGERRPCVRCGGACLP